MIYIGIDVGKKGVVAILSDSCDRVEVHDMPLTKDGEIDIGGACWLISHESAWSKVHVVIERQVAHHRTDKKFAKTINRFSIGRSFGQLEGIAVALAGVSSALTYETVPAQTWQKRLTKHCPGRNQKERSCLVAERLFPDAALRGPRGGIKDGRADALLIAEYGRMKVLP